MWQRPCKRHHSSLVKIMFFLLIDMGITWGFFKLLLVVNWVCLHLELFQNKFVMFTYSLCLSINKDAGGGHKSQCKHKLVPSASYMRSRIFKQQRNVFLDFLLFTLNALTSSHPQHLTYPFRDLISNFTLTSTFPSTIFIPSHLFLSMLIQGMKENLSRY